MAQIDGGDLVARMLKGEGIDTIFTLSGGHIQNIYDGCLDEGIRVIDTRHEQSLAGGENAPADLDHLVRRFSRRIDHLGKTGSELAMVIDCGVGQRLEWEEPEPIDSIGDGKRSAPDLLEKLFENFGMHLTSTAGQPGADLFEHPAMYRAGRAGRLSCRSEVWAKRQRQPWRRCRYPDEQGPGRLVHERLLVVGASLADDFAAGLPLGGNKCCATSSSLPPRYC